MPKHHPPTAPDTEELAPLHTEDSGPASNGEQVLTGRVERPGDTPDADGDPEAAERAAEEAEQRSIGRGG